VEITSYDPKLDFELALKLYIKVGWTAYTKDPVRLKAALQNSSLVLTSVQDGQLVGLVRCVSDGQTICFIQDILVDPGHQRMGIGKALLGAILEHFAHVRQVVLMTDNEEGQRRFYEGAGFREIAGELRGFVRIMS